MKKLLALLLVLTLLASFPLTAAAETVADNPSDTTKDAVASGDTVVNNNGTIGAYDGAGYPTDQETKGNFGAVTNNNGDISSNKGTVTTNNGTVLYNYGTVENNNATKDASGNVTSQGIVTVNRENGVVEENNGKVSYNYGEVTENNGTVGINESQGTVKDNTGTVNHNNGKVEMNDGIVKNAGTVTDNYGTVENQEGGTIGGTGTLQAVEEDGKVTVVETENGVTDTGTFYGVRGSGDGVDFTTVQVKEGIGATLRDLFDFTKAGHTLTGYRDVVMQTEYDLTAAVNGPIWQLVALWMKNPEAPAPAPAGDDTPAAPASNVKYYAPVSEKDGVYTFDAETTQLKGVYVNGKLVAPENYTISTDAQGRLEITFTAEYLATLAQGEHTVWLNLTDGGAVFKLIIE